MATEQINEIDAQQLIQRLRRAFFRRCAQLQELQTGQPCNVPDHVPSLDGGVDRWGREHQAVWPRIVDLLWRHKCLDAEGFIAAQFQTGKRPWPGQLCSEKAWDLYRKTVPGRTQLIRSAWDSQCHAFTLACQQVNAWFPEFTTREIERYVLLSEVFGLSPLFRYCLACYANLEEAQRLQPAALQQYLNDRIAYDTAWEKFIPDNLKIAAEEFFQVAPEEHSWM